MPWRDTAVELQESSRGVGESFGRCERRELAARAVETTARTAWGSGRTDMPRQHMSFGDYVLVTVLATGDLTAAQRSSVIGVCLAAHNNPAFSNLFTDIKSGGRHCLAYRGRELVSHAVVSTRWAQPEGLSILKTAFVDAVATLPAYQRLGYGSAVMRRLATEIDDYAIGCLQTDSPAFYERLGWEVWRGPLAGRSERGLIPTPQQRGVMVLRLQQTPSLDLEMQLTIECQPDRIWE